jgi:rubrerythrin
MDEHTSKTTVKPGQRVFDDEGNELGLIRGLTEEGFQVHLGDSVDHLDLEREPGREFGEGYLMWRCSDCGEMGELEDGYPGTCPGCGAPKRDLYAWLED